MQRLKSEQTTIKLILEEKDLELLSTREMLEEVNQEVAELKKLMTNREEQLSQATAVLKEKDEHVQIMQDDLNSTNLQVSEAETVVERIVALTSKLVSSVKEENGLRHQPLEKRADRRIQQLETELEMSRESLRTKETEVVSSQRALSIKEEVLKTVLGRLDAKEDEVTKMKKGMAEDVRNLHSLVQERTGEKSMGDLATEKLQLEAAELEVEAATSSLHKITDMSRELLSKVRLSMDTDVFPDYWCDPTVFLVEDNECVKAELIRLATLCEKLLEEAGIVVAGS